MPTVNGVVPETHTERLDEILSVRHNGRYSTRPALG